MKQRNAQVHGCSPEKWKPQNGSRKDRWEGLICVMKQAKFYNRGMTNGKEHPNEVSYPFYIRMRWKAFRQDDKRFRWAVNSKFTLNKNIFDNTGLKVNYLSNLGCRDIPKFLSRRKMP